MLLDYSTPLLTTRDEMDYNTFFTEEIVDAWLTESQHAMQDFMVWSEKHNVFLSNKQTSEIFSRLLESKGAEVFQRYYEGEVVNASTDDQPDLKFDEKPLEIKVTNGDQWTGGEFSKRPSDYLLVSRNEDFTKFFVCLVNIQKEEWISGNEGYYGTFYRKKQLMEKQEKHVYRGGIEYNLTKNNKIRGIKITKG
jgi:hypothetical protein